MNWAAYRSRKRKSYLHRMNYYSPRYTYVRMFGFEYGPLIIPTWDERMPEREGGDDE